MENAGPDPAENLRRRSTYSTSTYSTTSSSSPEFTNDTVDSVITPDSDDDQPMEIVPKIEEVEEASIDGLEESKPTVILPTPRKRGRPRKHPLQEQKKASHSRSKTGCGTCRRRKKKCDETKPSCINCEKNNVVCDGYEPKQPWRSGRQRALTVRHSIPAELPMLVEGVEGSVDQMFFHHFTAQVGKVLSLTDHQNPFLEIIVPMAMGHTGLMHSLLYLSGSILVANEPNPKSDWEERQEHHSSKAMRLLQQDLASTTSNGTDAVAHIGDPSIAQTLVLCLQTVCAGDLTGSYRFHLNAMKEMLSRQQHFPNEQLRQFILEFLLYHDYSSSITSLANPLDQRSIDLMDGFKLPEFMIQPQAGTLLGVMDGLFGFISRIRQLRDQIRERRALNYAHWWDAAIMDDAFAIDNALRMWQCVHPPDTPRYTASLLYRQCTWLYLHRTIQHSRPSPAFKQAVDEGLGYLRSLPWDTDDGSTQSILLMPLFLLGCAAFEPSQRPEISDAFSRLQQWSSLGNIKYARMIVEQIWQMMDEGREAETWDWETIIAKRGWDFLVT
ncbi:hypothetical protein KC367_g1348 [Hortaea werneckii]|uniref:Zn(2)-C6 fungal-type domain-containing protein n=2 Tax=Hortaea werneckii TaxID=91943 RepID=A0A3M7I162_HORWE|nr:hypothetical protein KC350_g18267 [Hortaea werneckii]OTA39772.1 hypothetical protein BTJ68_00462 [Hortaea werneckii EXF-2000]KAI6796413.1 hypothetical protein KC358_g16638 [Hortaea werneckii]KAI6900937.1 hypothetical protein KC348_g16641 [Hortaea werneckii]KAI6920524.1 hypothetical protein KC341_g16552 [Hortaea werneckii]